MRSSFPMFREQCAPSVGGGWGTGAGGTTNQVPNAVAQDYW